MMFLAHLACSVCARRFEADALHRLCPDCERPLMARYDLEAAREELDPTAFQRGVPSMWRFRPLLPVDEVTDPVTLGEGMTPLVGGPRLADEAGVASVAVKDEGQNPTGTFKSRGMSMAVTASLARGAERFAVPTAGNAGAALAAYAARAGVEARIVAPADAPPAVFDQADAYGAAAEKVDGLITDAGARVRELVEAGDGWWDLSTLKEPFRLEGKKTMGLELWLQHGGELPDVVVYPTGGGTGLVGMWKAFDELEELGWIGSDRPRLVSVQSAGCAPIVRAFHDGADAADPWEDADTVAGGLRVPEAVGDVLILRALRGTDGTAVAVPDEAILQARRDLPKRTGVSACTEAAAPLAGLRALAADGWLERDDRVVLFSTGAGWTG